MSKRKYQPYHKETTPRAAVVRPPTLNIDKQSASIILVSILILAAALRFLYLAQIQTNPLPEQVTRIEAFDQYRFMEPVKEFLKGNWLGTQVPVRYSIAYSYLIAVLYYLFYQSINTIFVFQIVLGLAAVYIFYRAASLIFNDRAIGLIAAFAAAVYSPFLFQECNMERGAIIAYSNLLGFYFLLKALRKYKWRYFLFSGLAIGASMVMRTNALVPFLAAYIFFAVKRPYKFKILFMVLFLAGVMLVTSPLSIRNKMVGNTFSAEPQGIENFWVGNTHDSPGVDFWQLPSRLELTKESDNNAFKALRIFIREIGKYPSEYRSLYGRKIKMFFNAYEVPANLSYDLFKENHSALVLSFLTFGIVCPLALLGMGLVWKKYPQMGLLYLFVCVLSISNIIFHIQGRYRIPAVPFFIIFFSYAIYWCVNMTRKKELPALCMAALIVALLILYTRPDDKIIKYCSGARIRGIDYFNLAFGYFEEAKDKQVPIAKNEILVQKTIYNLHKSIKVSPRNLNAYLFLGDVYYQSGQYEAAKEVFNGALILDPNNKIAKSYLENMALSGMGK